MYDYFFGKLVSKNPAEVVLDVAGVGYHFLVSLVTFSAAPEPGQLFRLYTHLQIREDAHQLFGFSSEEERHTFRLLISVTGIGPKLGITVLSGIGPDRLQQAIASGDITTLTQIPGIGKKTAERLVVELREKFTQKMKVSGISRPEGVAPSAYEDSLSALMALGYKRPEAERAVARVFEQFPGAAVEKVVREALAVML